MALILGLIQLVLAGPCPTQEGMLEVAEQLLFEGRVEAAAQQHAALFASLDCDQAFETKWVHRLWIFEGSLRHYQGQEEASTLAFQSTSEVEQWPTIYGPELKHQRESALAIAPDPIPSNLRLPRHYTAFIDGVHSDANTLLSPSPHLLQIRSPDDLHQLSLRHDFSAGQPALPELPRVRSQPLLFSAAALGGSTITALLIAQHHANQIRNADSVGSVEQNFRHQQNALTSAAALGAASLTLGMTWWLW